MTNEAVKISAVAKNYANALIEIAQKGNPNFEVLAADLNTVMDTLNMSKDLAIAMENPAVDLDTKNNILNEIFEGKISSQVITFLKILVEKKRFTEFSQIYAEFINKYNKVHNIQPVTVVSAIKLSEIQQSQIVEKLTAKLNKKILPNWLIDEDIIAGITVKIEDNILDMSLKNRIEKLGKSLMLK